MNLYIYIYVSKPGDQRTSCPSRWSSCYGGKGVTVGVGVPTRAESKNDNQRE